MVHNQWMKTLLQIQDGLYEALGEAIVAHDAPPFMTAEKEALALASLCSTVAAELKAGECRIVRLMALSQQAMRAATMGLAQAQERDVLVETLMQRATLS